MADIFDAKIVCKRCEMQMQPKVVQKNGLELRAVQCPKCSDIIIHPADLNNSKQYDSLRNKTYTVKLRVVGNSHAISIPKEILEFMEEAERSMHKQMSDMARLCFEDFGKLRVEFFNEEEQPEELLEENHDPEIVEEDATREIPRRKRKQW